jgi:hypothetical protein
MRGNKMVDLRVIDVDKNEVTFDNFEKVSFNEFQNEFIKHWNGRIAGETISPFDIERFMKRGSSKNLKQLVDGKKAEGFMEATIGRKMDPGLIKMILILAVVGAIALIALFVLKQMGWL